MSAKEKAEELVDKIYYCQKYADGEDYIPLQAYKRAKQCALLAVDEVLNVWENQQPRRFEEWLGIFQYWQEVKQEIKNL
jgi:hypothetical protein